MNNRYGINYSLYSKWHFWLFFLLTCIPKSQKHIIIGKRWKKGISIHWHKWFLFSDLHHNCFTFQCHEMLLWSNATRPTVHTQSTILPNLASIPPVMFILLVFGVGEQTATAWPASAVRQQTPPGSHHWLKAGTSWWSAREWSLPLSELEDTLVHTVPLIMENMEEFILLLYVTGVGDHYPLHYFEIQI